MSRIAVFEDDAEERHAITLILEIMGFTVCQLHMAMRDVHLCFIALDSDGALDMLAGVGSSIPSVVMCLKRSKGGQDLDRALECGAKAYLVKPARVQAVRGMILRYVSHEKSDLPAAHHLTQGSQIREYEQVRLLGSGSFANVYLVRRGDVEFARKEIRLTHLTAKDQQRALRETALHQTLDNPCVVQFFDAWMDRVGNTDRLCLLMEYVQGGSLTACLDRWRATETQVPNSLCIDWLSQITIGLMYLHSKRIVHRDLKTDNILGPTPDNLIKLGDFGTSKMMCKSVTNSMVGTPLTMAPERCQHEIASLSAEYDAGGHGIKSDMWSLGIVLYELQTLRTPFSARAAPQATPFAEAQYRVQLFENICAGKYEPLPTSRPELLRTLTTILLDRDPANRPSCVDLVRTYDVLQEGIVAFVRRAKLVRHAGVVEVLEVANNTVSLGDIDCVTLSLRLSGERDLSGSRLRAVSRGGQDSQKLRIEHGGSTRVPVDIARNCVGKNVQKSPSENGVPLDTFLASPELPRSAPSKCKNDAMLPPLNSNLRRCNSEYMLEDYDRRSAIEKSGGLRKRSVFEKKRRHSQESERKLEGNILPSLCRSTFGRQPIISPNQLMCPLLRPSCAKTGFVEDRYL